MHMVLYVFKKLMGKGEVLERTDYRTLSRVYLDKVDAMGAPMLKLACTYAKMWGK